MAVYPPDSMVLVRPFSHRQDGPSVTIGDLSRQVFLAIPAEGLDILNALAAGKTVGEAVALYEQKYAETPDVDDFLSVLAGEGFLAPAGKAGEAAEPKPAPQPPAPATWITPTRARRIFSPPVLAASALIVAVASVLIATDPQLVRGSTVLLFPRHLAALSLCLLAFALAGVMVHEVAHLVAARAAGVPARIGLSHRLWIVVAETDMTGVWMAPRRQRYLAFLAGPIVDAVSASLLVGLLWASRRGWIGLSPLVAQLGAAALFTYLARLLWQCFVFVRTDFYYVLATALGCRNLLADSEAHLHNLVARLRHRVPQIDQSAIPPAEMRVVRGYAVVWFVGRVVALASLVALTLPFLGRYLAETAHVLTGRQSPYGIVDILTVTLAGPALEVLGLFLWIRSLYRARMSARTQRRSDAMAA